MNAPATFQRVLDTVLAQFRWQTCLCYIDDIIIFSNSEEEHFSHVEENFQTLEKANIKLKLQKCEFFNDKIRYLGYVITPGKLHIDEALVAPLKQAEVPTTKQELRSCLGLCNVYRRFC